MEYTYLEIYTNIRNLTPDGYPLKLLNDIIDLDVYSEKIQKHFFSLTKKIDQSSDIIEFIEITVIVYRI